MSADEVEIIDIVVQGVRCQRCNYEWVPRNLDHLPQFCASCNSPYWDRPRRDA